MRIFDINTFDYKFVCSTSERGIREMDTGLPTATLLNFKKSHKHWTAFMQDGTKTKVCLPVADLKIFDGKELRDIGPSEKRPKPERTNAVLVKFEEMALGSRIVGWALAS